ncbi:DNA-processing protein DprA [Candidatus Gracilibacteria bacterium]|nr:DNA-processing protein DprA [Candidatus Gracilibacteria bacterium]
MEEKIYLAGLHALGISHAKLTQIFEKKQNYKEVYENISSSFLKKFGFTQNQITTIIENRKKQFLSQINNKLQARKVQIYTITDSEFPDTLKNIPHTPYLIYVRGKIPQGPALSVVGSRSMTSYGSKCIENIVAGVCEYFTIISGGAAGCDTWAHKVALEKSCPTIAVIGTGIDQDYPVSNKKIYDYIANHKGAVISIFPVETPGNPYNFPIRNELVAGMSLGVLVVEAKQKSGTLITANLALDMGKEVFAIPGDIFHSQSAGCNTLIQSGTAKPVLTKNCILEEFNVADKKSVESVGKNRHFENKLEQQMYNALFLEPLSIDQMGEKIEVPSKKISHHVSILEIGGYIKKTLGGKYEIA